MDYENKDTSSARTQKRELPGALEGAFAVVLAQSALLVSLPMISIAETKRFTFDHFLILAIAIVTFFNVAANWVSSREVDRDPVDYNSSHLFWDIAILGVLFVSTQVIIGLCGDDFSIDSGATLAVTSVSYLLLSTFYITWNLVEIKRRRKIHKEELPSRVDVLITANTTNAVTAFLSLALLFCVIYYPNTVAQGAIMILWFTAWVYICIKFVTDNSLY